MSLLIDFPSESEHFPHATPPRRKEKKVQRSKDAKMFLFVFFSSFSLSAFAALREIS
jgi:hypothetical protein